MKPINNKWTTINIYSRCLVLVKEQAVLVSMPRSSAYAHYTFWVSRKFIHSQTTQSDFSQLTLNSAYKYQLRNKDNDLIILTGQELLESFSQMNRQIRQKLNGSSKRVIDLDQVEQLLFDSSIQTLDIAKETELSSKTISDLREKIRPLSGARLETVIRLSDYATKHRKEMENGQKN